MPIQYKPEDEVQTIKDKVNTVKPGGLIYSPRKGSYATQQSEDAEYLPGAKTKINLAYTSHGKFNSPLDYLQNALSAAGIQQKKNQFWQDALQKLIDANAATAPMTDFATGGYPVMNLQTQDQVRQATSDTPIIDEYVAGQKTGDEYNAMTEEEKAAYKADQPVYDPLKQDIEDNYAYRLRDWYNELALAKLIKDRTQRKTEGGGSKTYSGQGYYDPNSYYGQGISYGGGGADLQAWYNALMNWKII